jgi:hypothetical protein
MILQIIKTSTYASTQGSDCSCQAKMRNTISHIRLKEKGKEVMKLERTIKL